jgi:hypothetical protein
MLTVFVLLALVAFICTIANALDRCPLWIAVLILSILELMRALPMGK